MKHFILYALVLIISVSACNKKEVDTHDEHEGHDHGVVKLFFTEYTNEFELFAEADPFVKGNPSEILAHFTKLEDFKPLSKASITVSLVNGSNIVKQTLEKPIKPGIYKFSITPKVNGSSKLIFEIESEKNTHKIIVKNISVYGDEHTAIHIADKKQVTYINAINFSKEQSWKIDFATVYPHKEQIGKVIKSTAQILPGQTDETIITAKTNGTVKFNKHLLEGQFVEAGKALISISGKGLANDNAEVRYTEAKNNFELAKANYDRKVALLQKQIVSEKEMESAKAEYENAKAVYQNLKSNFNENGQMVISPNDGIIKHVLVDNGEYVEAGTPLFSVVNNRNLIIKAEVQQKQFPYLKNISTANIKSTTDNKLYTLKELKGELISYGKTIDEDEGYLIPVNFIIKENSAFLPGSFVDIYIKTKANKESLIVPNTSLIEEQGNYFVFVQLTPERFEKREVKIGVTDGINTEILTGISQEDRVVSKGAIIVKLAAVSNSLDPHAGHVH